MPARKLISEKMAEFLGVIAHQHRIRIIAELYAGEQNVSSIQSILRVSQSVASQHLSILKAHKIIKQRKEGNLVFYHLTQPELTRWLLDGLTYIEGVLQSGQGLLSAVNEARIIWCQAPKSL